VSVIGRAALDSQKSYAVRELAEDICRGLPSKAYLDEYLAIYYYLLSHCRYMRDPRTVELVRAPYVVVEELRRGKTPSVDCDDLAALATALTLSAGGHSRVVTVAFRPMIHRGQRQYSHVFAQAQEPRTKQWITIDPVAGSATEQMMRRTVYAKAWPIA